VLIARWRRALVQRWKLRVSFGMRLRPHCGAHEGFTTSGPVRWTAREAPAPQTVETKHYP
jgi:hypothetical protein